LATRKITEQQWKSLKNETHNTSMAILESVEVLIKHTQEPSYGKDATPIICAGLYTHAVEEYGKLLLLQGYKPVNGFVEFEYDEEFKDHTTKFKLALGKLPDECKRLSKGIFDPSIFNNKIFDVGTIADWYARLKILNTDINDKGNVIKYPSIDLEMLQKAVHEFRTVMYGVKI